MNPQQQQVLKALSTVQDPDLKQNLVALNMIRDVIVTDDKIAFSVILTTPACPLKAKIEADCKAAVTPLLGARALHITMGAQTHNKKATNAVGAIPGVTHIIAVGSGKGGVGKSTVAANIALALANLGASVGLLDTDIYGPNIPTMLGVTEQPTLEQHPEKGERFIPPIAHNVKVMSMGFLIQQDQPVVWRGPMLHSIVHQFCHQVRWGELDYLIIDLPPGTGDVQLSLAQVVPVTAAVLVTTASEVALQDVRKAYYMLDKVRIPVIGLVENMSMFSCSGCGLEHVLFGQDSTKRLAADLGLEILTHLPMVPFSNQGTDRGIPAVLSQDERLDMVALKKNYISLAQKVAQQVSILTAVHLPGNQPVEIGFF